MLYFDTVVGENLPEKTNFAVLCLDNLILGVDDLNELGILILERFFFSLFGPFCASFDILVVMVAKHACYY